MKHFIYGAVASLILVLPAVAQTGPVGGNLNGPVGGNLNLQYREPIPQNGSADTARAAILSDAEQACAAVQKAFGLPCTINNIQFNNGFGFGGPQPQGNFVTANVNLNLVPSQNQ